MSREAAREYEKQKAAKGARDPFAQGKDRDRDAHYRAGASADTPLEIPGRGWWAILKRTYQAMGDKDLGLMCAGVAFYGFLSIFPLVAAAVLIYGLFASPASLEGQLAALEGTVPDAAMAIIRDRLTQLIQQPSSGLGIGLVVSLALALWSGSRGVNALILAIGEAYHEDDDRGFLSSALLSLGLTLGGIVFIGVALGAIAVVPALFNAMQFGATFETVVSWLRWPILAVFVVTAIAVLYRLAPHRDDARWSWLTPGAMTAAVLWLILSVCFSLYVEYFGNYSATFGSLAGAVIMMLWIYYSVMVFVFGAALNGQMELQTRKDTTTGTALPMGARGAFVADATPADVAQGPAEDRPAHPRREAR